MKQKMVEFIKLQMPFMPLQVLNDANYEELKQLSNDIERITKARAEKYKQQGKKTKSR